MLRNSGKAKGRRVWKEDAVRADHHARPNDDGNPNEMNELIQRFSMVHSVESKRLFGIREIKQGRFHAPSQECAGEDVG